MPCQELILQIVCIKTFSVIDHDSILPSFTTFFVINMALILEGKNTKYTKIEWGDDQTIGLISIVDCTLRNGRLYLNMSFFARAHLFLKLGPSLILIIMKERESTNPYLHCWILSILTRTTLVTRVFVLGIYLFGTIQLRNGKLSFLLVRFLCSSWSPEEADN